MLVMNDVERQSETATNQIMESFKAWLLQQAHKDSQNDFRQTRAYDLYVRLDSE